MNKALFSKETRYGIGRLIAMPLLCVAAVYLLYHINDVDSQRSQFRGLFAEEYQGATAAACALVGLACGLWQALFEMRPGPWAFLRHRPVTASRIFIAKLLAALLIYIAIVGVPILGVILWASGRGHLPGPWLWEMAVPSLVDLFAGSVYVPAGLLIASRQARWFGSKLLPVALALCASFGAFVPWLWLAIVFIAVAWLILLPAAFSSFINHGAQRRRGKAGGFAVGLTLVPAAIAIPLLIAGFASMINDLFTDRPASVLSHYYTVIGGELYQIDYSRQRNNYRLAVDEKGNLLADSPAMDKAPQGTGASVQYAGFRDYTLQYRDALTYYDVQQMDASFSQTRIWFWLHKEKLAQEWIKPAAGRSEFRRYIGSDGPAASRADAVPFNPTFATQHRQPLLQPIVEPTRVLSVDQTTGEVHTLFTTPPGERAVSAGRGDDAHCAVATDTTLYVVDKDQQTLFRRAHEPGYISVTLSPAKDGLTYGLIYMPENYWMGRQLFLRCDREGNVLTRTEIPPAQMAYRPASAVNEILETIAIPPGVVVTDAVHSVLYERLRWHHAIGMVVALIGALANWLLIRRDAVGRGLTIFWIIIGALGGFAGILLLLWTHTFPPRVRCQGCNRKRVVNRATCEHCGQPFAQPVTNGIGIFDSARSTAFAVTE